MAGAVFAQQPDEQQSSPKGKRAQQKAHATQAQPGANQRNPQGRPAKQRGAMKERGAMNERGAANQSGADRGQKAHTGNESTNAPEENAPAKSTGESANEPGAGNERDAQKRRQGRAQQESANAPDTGTEGRAAGMPTHRGKGQVQERKQAQGVKQPMTEGGATSASSAAGPQNAQAKGKGTVKKPDPQQVQQVKSQHASFRAQPKPQQVQAVTFNQNRRIEGSDSWQGAHYEVFRSYRPEWHDAGWYHSHYPNVVLIAGGYYFFNNGYWFPAWGYNPSVQYYAYDGPIYVGQRAVPPDQVIADTQALLQQMGYYRGEVDGLLGPLTREALTAYQTENGLTVTAAIDQPTLDSLGLA